MSLDPTLLDEIACKCHSALLDGRCPQGVVSYLKNERGLNLKSVRDANIGFCTIDIEKFANTDFYAEKEEEPFISPYRLRDRITIPIYSDCGDIVGIATRPVGKKQPWWNTPFVKGNHLYNLNLARSACFATGKVYLVEGYIDARILFQCGLHNVVCGMGTRFTLAHAGLVLRYCSGICLVFDTDPPKENGKLGAGQEATQRTLLESKDYFEKTTVISLPLGVDPDEFVLERGLNEFLSLEREPELEEFAVEV